MRLLFCTYRIGHETSPILNQLSQFYPIEIIPSSRNSF